MQTGKQANRLQTNRLLLLILDDRPPGLLHRRLHLYLGRVRFKRAIITNSQLPRASFLLLASQPLARPSYHVDLDSDQHEHQRYEKHHNLNDDYGDQSVNFTHLILWPKQ